MSRRRRSFIRKFTVAEGDRIRLAAIDRIENHRGASWSIDKNALRNESFGIASEWAVCEWLGVSEEPVFRSYGRGGDGGSRDVQMMDGRMVSVKGTVWQGGGLILPPYEEFTADYAVLCVRLGALIVRNAGYATLADWSACQTQRDLHRGVGLQKFMDQEVLRPFEELLPVADAAIQLELELPVD